MRTCKRKEKKTKKKEGKTNTSSKLLAYYELVDTFSRDNKSNEMRKLLDLPNINGMLDGSLPIRVFVNDRGQNFWLMIRVSVPYEFTKYFRSSVGFDAVLSVVRG